MESSKAIPFILKNFDNDTYSLSPQAEEFLSKINTPISVITVAGLYRTGKSYLLNRVILNRSSGFTVGPTVNPCTKGLWLWAEPIRTSDNKTFLVIDTQGLGALDEQSNHDMKIFGLAVLLSSMFIYNSVGSIDENALQSLSLVLNLLNTIDHENYSSRPSFIWVVRDFSLQLVNQNGNQITPDQYLQQALSIQNLKEPQKIQLRKTITTAFTVRHCFTLIKPLIDEQKLQNLDKIPEDQLRAQFVLQTINLRKHIMTSLKQLKLNNSQTLKGSEYLIMVKRYLQAINNGKMPNIVDTWTFIKDEKAKMVAEQLRQVHTDRIRNKLSNRMPMPTQKLKQIITIFKQQITEDFIKMTYQDIPNQDIITFANNMENELHKLNNKQTKNFIIESMKKQFEPYSKKLYSHYYTDIIHFENEVRNGFRNNFIEKYSDKIDFSLFEIELYAQKKINQGVKIFDKRVKQELTKQKLIVNQMQIAWQNERKVLVKNSDEERKKLQEQIYNLQKNNTHLANCNQKLEQNQIKLKFQEQVTTEKQKRKIEDLNAMISSLTQDLARNQALATNHERNYFLAKKQIQKEKALYFQKQDHLVVKNNELEKRCQTFQQEYEKLISRNQSQKKQIMYQHDMRIRDLQRQIKDANDHQQDILSSYEQQRFLKQKLQKQIAYLKSKHHDQLQSYKEKILNSNKKEARNIEIQELNRSFKQLKDQFIKSEAQNHQLELKIKQLNDQINQMKINHDNLQAIHIQKIEFHQIELNDLRNKNIELNKAYSKYLENSHHDNRNVEEMYQKKLSETSQQYHKQLKFAQEEYENKLIAHKKQMTLIIKNKQDLELQWSLDRKKWEVRQQQQKYSYHQLQENYQQLLIKITSSQKNFSQLNKQKQQFYMMRMNQLELQIEQTKERAAKEIEQNQKKTQETLDVVKNYYQMERSQWQKRIEEQKQKANKKIGQIKEQYNRKQSEDRESYQSTIIDLQDKIANFQAHFNQKVYNIKYDYDIKIQKISNIHMEQKMDINKRNALLAQEIQLTKMNFDNIMETKRINFEKQIQALRRQLSLQHAQNLRKIKDELQFMESKYENLKQSNRKVQQSNLLLKSELDKEKNSYKEKQMAFKKQIHALQGRLEQEMLENTKNIEQMSYQNQIERSRLNTQIEKLKQNYNQLQQTFNLKMQEYNQDKNALNIKYNHLEARHKRSKDDYEDVLKKFQATVKSMANNQSKTQMQRQFQEVRSRMKNEYERKIAQKEDQIQREIKEYTDKIFRLQTENKTLRDKLLLFEMKVKGREQYTFEDIEKVKDQYEKKIYELMTTIKKLKDDQSELSSKMQKSRISDKSERHSFISELGSQASVLRPLNQNKSLINRKYSNISANLHTNMPTTTIKKQEKGGRNLNVQTFEGIMKWQ